jgi:hypothetical protein
MTVRLKHRYCIKFCQKLGDTQEETICKFQQVFSDYAVGITKIKEWFNRFLRVLRDAVGHKRSELWDERNWQLHHDNAPAHSSH